MYLSIHQNFIIGDKWRGIQIFYNDRVKENEVIAKTLTNALKEYSKLVRDEKKNNEYYMYKQINVPGVLIETGFLSNPDDRYLLQSEEYQEKIEYMIETNEVVQKANERAEEIKEKAQKYKYEMIERSNQYAEDVLSFLEQKLEETLEEVKNNKRELNPRM